MMRPILSYLILTLFAFAGSAQEVIPADGSELTRTSVMLEVPEVIGAVSYEYRIDAYEQETIVLTDPNHVVRIDSLSFGEHYDWEVDALDAQGGVIRSFKQGFDVLFSPLVDPELTRFRIAKRSEDQHVNGVLFLDYSRVAITPDGTPIWFLRPQKSLENDRLRDFKLTPRGTLTFLSTRKCQEQTLDGTIEWSTPQTGDFSGDTTDYYHHEFTRLSNGHYMVLGKSFVESDLTVNGTQITRIPLSIIIEYDAEGNVVWTWSSNEYVKDEDILKVGHKVAIGNTFGHMNSFFFDEQSNIVYAGFRDLNCILAIDKESGKIIRSYGDKVPSDSTRQAIGFFRKQHAPIKLPGDKILLFNNNDRKQPSSAQIISEVTETNPVSKIEWEFTCDFDTLMPHAAGRMGNALPLDSNHLLVNMGTVARLFEVTTDKNVLWQCLPETRDDANADWKAKPNYRVFQASSLYPYYHTISLRGDQIEISNEGSENDQYTIAVYTKPGKRRKAKTKNLQVNHGASVQYSIVELLEKKRLPKSIFVEVTSVSNPDRVVLREYSLR